MTYTIRFPDGYTKPALPGRDLWVAALRSGSFKQGKGALSYHGQYCCLGVLCTVQNRPFEDVKLDDEFAYLRFDGTKVVLAKPNPLYGQLYKSGNFPEGVTVITTPEYSFPRGQPGGHHGSLACCNDDDLTFLQIADIIEAVWDNAEPNWNT